MNTAKFEGSPVEPAHPMQIRLQESLLQIYGQLRAKFQTDIDRAFDLASSQIGFVVTTTLPVSMNVKKDGSIDGPISIDSKQFKGTVFEKTLAEPFEKILKTPFSKKVQPGLYRIYIFWFEALKLKLRTDWIEPAHFERGSILERLRYIDWRRFIPLGEIPVKPEVMEPAHPVGPEVLEPAHWFDPVFTPPIEEAIMITVIDEIYPELRLIEKIASIRERRRRPVFPEVQEPAHYRQFSKPIDTDKLKEIISQLGNLLRNLGY